MALRAEGQASFGTRYLRESDLRATGGVESWRGRDVQDGRAVVVRHATVAAPMLLLEQECLALQDLRPRGCAAVLDCGSAGGRFWIAREYLPGETLRDLLDRGPLAAEEALRLAAALCEPLHALHGAGLVHRNLKPENVLAGDAPALLDAAMPRSMFAERWLREAGDREPLYVAPESAGYLQVRPGPASDLYSLGLVLAEMLVGPDTLGQGPPDRVLAQRLRTTRLSLRGRVPAPVDELVGRLTEVDPRRRYQDALELHADLERALRRPSSRGSVAAPRALPPEPPLLGRDSELARFEEAAERGGRYPVLAPSGGGKSRLLEEVGLRARRRGIEVLSVRTRTPDSVGGEALVPSLLGLEAVAPEPQRSVEHLVARLAERAPAVLLVDDLQWADAMDLQLLAALKVPALLVVGAARSEEVAAVERLAAVSWDARLELPGWSEADLARVVETLAGSVPEGLPTRLRDLSGGNPFLALEALHHWWPRRQHGLPEVLEGRSGDLLARRLEALPAEAAETLARAALLGDEVEIDLLAAVEDASPVPTLQVGSQARLLWLAPEGRTFRFSHHRVREALLARLAPALSRETHSRAADWLGACPEPDEGRLAWHLAAAGREAEAAEPALRAARRAAAQVDMAGAETLFGLAWQGLARERVEERAEAAAGLGAARLLQGRYPEAIAILLEGRDAGAGALHLQRLAALLGEAHSRLHDLDEAERWIFEAVELGGVMPPPRGARLGLQAFLLALSLNLRRPHPADEEAPQTLRELARVVERLMFAQSMEARPLTGAWAFLRVLEELQKYRPCGELAFIRAMVSNLFAWIGLRGLGDRWADLAREALVHCASDWDRGCTAGRIGATLSWTGRLQDADELLGMARSLLEGSRDPWECRAARYHHDLVHYWRGALAEPRAHVAATYREAVLCGDRLHAAAAAMLAGWCGVRLPGLASGAEEWSGPRSFVILQMLQNGRALQMLLEDRREEAVEILEAVLATPGSTQPCWYRQGNMLWLAHALRRLAERPTVDERERRQLLERGARHLAKARLATRSFPFMQPMAAREEALLALRRGRPQAARSAFVRSLAAARRLGMQWEEALTLQEWGRAGRVLGWAEAEEHVRAAHVARIRLGLPGDGPLPDPEPEGPPGESLSLAARHQALLGAVADVLRPGAEPVNLDAAVRWAECVVPGASVRLEEGAPPPGALVVPVECRDGVPRVLVAGGRESGVPFLEDEKRSIAAVARMLSAALDHAHESARRHRAMADLAASEERHRTLLSSAGAGVALLTPEGRLVDWNPMLVEMLRLDAAEAATLSGRPFTELLAQDERRVDEEVRRWVLAGEIERERREVRYLRPGGVPAWALLTCAAWRSSDGEVQGVVRTLTDVSLQRLDRLIRLQEQERHLLACDLHDQAAQMATGLRMGLEVLAHGDTRLGDARDAARSLEGEIARLLQGLRSPTEDGGSTVAALRSLAVRSGSWDLHLDLDPRLDSAPARVRAFTYRILQEALGNCARHARARTVHVSIAISRGMLRGSVRDDGQGLPPGPAAASDRQRPSYGMQGMRWRCELLGGRLAVVSAPGQGTEVRFTLPLESSRPSPAGS